MKFTKEQFSEALKAKLTANGKKLAQSDRTFNAHVERIYKRLEKRDDDSELDDTVAEYLPDFEDIEGNMRKDNSDFIKNWEKDHKPADKQVDKPKDEPEDKYDALMKEIENLKKENETAKRERNVAEKKSKLLSMFKEKGIDDEKWASAYLSKLAISEDMDDDKEASDALSLFNKANSHTSVQTPGAAGGGSSDDSSSFDDIKAKLKRERGAIEQK